MSCLKEFKVDNLHVRVFNNRESLGKTAGGDIAAKIRELLSEKGEVNVIFAAAPSQNETLEALAAAGGIDWTRVNAFHMDEYIGLESDAPQGFGNFLKERLFSRLPFRSVSYINGQCEDAEAECARYAKLLTEKRADIVCMGIGENGHIAFNDPAEANFQDRALVKRVTLDERCRMQQVNDGCFGSIGEVPLYALTLTIPALCAAPYIFCMVPAQTKAEAVYRTLRGGVSETCPASILRTCGNARLYCDADSGRRILFRKSIITDEISQDFEEAADVAARYGCEAVEIRSVWGKQPHELSEADIEKINSILDKYGLKTCAVSASVFKCDIDNRGEIEEHYGRLRKSAELALKTGAQYVRGFTFWRKYALDSVLDRIAAELRRASEIIGEYGKTLVIENEPATPTATAAELLTLFERLDAPNVMINWDPGNQVYFDGGEPPSYPDGYESIKRYVRHVHIKDAVKDLCVAPGKGLLDIKGQLAALLRDGYDGFVSLEPHFRLEGDLSGEAIKAPGGDDFSREGRAPSEISLAHLNSVTDEIAEELR